LTLDLDRYPEIDGVVAYIHQHLYDPLPLQRLAKYAGYSPFHFARIFKEKVGLPPLYYVSSLRLEKAKDLLLNTNLSVRDIGLEIGQQSLGTFTTRFTERVGQTPTEFRNAPSADDPLRALQGLDRPRLQPSPPFPMSLFVSRIEGEIRAEAPFDGVVLVGLFPKPIPEGIPLYGTIVSPHEPFSLTGVQPGTYYLMATSVSWGTRAADMLVPRSTLRTRSREPIVVPPRPTVIRRDVALYPPRLDDPPILISLPLLMNRFLDALQPQRTRPAKR